MAIAARTSNLANELATGYAAVEQYEQASVPGPATDFYALGATLYYCMTQRYPDAVQSRIMALSKGEPDPMTLPVVSAGTAYSAKLLQAINNTPNAIANKIQIVFGSTAGTLPPHTFVSVCIESNGCNPYLTGTPFPVQ